MFFAQALFIAPFLSFATPRTRSRLDSGERLLLLLLTLRATRAPIRLSPVRQWRSGRSAAEGEAAIQEYSPLPRVPQSGRREEQVGQAPRVPPPRAKEETAALELAVVPLTQGAAEEVTRFAAQSPITLVLPFLQAVTAPGPVAR